MRRNTIVGSVYNSETDACNGTIEIMGNLVFVHATRTGGSSIWHNLVSIATHKGVGICDIYHESKLENGRPIPVEKVLQRFRQKHGSIPTLFHHHTAEPIFHHFGKNTLFATVLRDPIDRFVSIVSHIRAFLTAPDVDPRYKAYNEEFLGRDYLRAVYSDVDPRELLDVAAKDTYFQNYYISLFRSLCSTCSTSCSTPNRLNSSQKDPLTPYEIELLAEIIFTRFAVIGYFDDLGLAYQKIVHRFDLGANGEKMKLSVNQGQKRPLLSTEEREKYRPIFRQDYHLLASLRSLSSTS